ncbi:hypothetical protein ACQ4PT_048209 [Festuca glaucescens]
MPEFCGVCGLVGHVTKEHGSGLHEEGDIIYPPTLIALEFRRDEHWGMIWWKRCRASFGNGSQGGGRGRGRGGQEGRGAHAASCSSDADSEDLWNTSSSPKIPPAGLVDKHGTAKRRLDLVKDKDGQEGNVLLLTNKPFEEEVDETESNYQDSKRKKTGDAKPMDQDLATAAGPKGCPAGANEYWRVELSRGGRYYDSSRASPLSCIFGPPPSPPPAPTHHHSIFSATGNPLSTAVRRLYHQGHADLRGEDKVQPDHCCTPMSDLVSIGAPVVGRVHSPATLYRSIPPSPGCSIPPRASESTAADCGAGGQAMLSSCLTDGLDCGRDLGAEASAVRGGSSRRLPSPPSVDGTVGWSVFQVCDQQSGTGEGSLLSPPSVRGGRPLEGAEGWSRPGQARFPPCLAHLRRRTRQARRCPPRGESVGWKRRPRGPAVPNERPPSVGRVPALEASLRGFASRRKDVIVSPTMGTVFGSLQRLY